MKDLGPVYEPSPIPGVTRRRVLLAGGVTMVASFAGCRSSTAVSVPATGVVSNPRASAEAARVSDARVATIENMRKPVFVAERGMSIRLLLTRRQPFLEEYEEKRPFFVI